MSPLPRGQVRTTPLGADLMISRTFRASLDDVWTSVTASESTARWIGPWTGDAGPGKWVKLQLAFEKGQPSSDVLIEICEPPQRLVVRVKDSSGEWRIELGLERVADTTKLTLTQPLTDPAAAGDMGPGWEYYLDMLVAARDGTPLPQFADYYPAQKAYYLGDARV